MCEVELRRLQGLMFTGIILNPDFHNKWWVQGPQDHSRVNKREVVGVDPGTHPLHPGLLIYT